MTDRQHRKIGFIFDDASWQTRDLLRRLDAIDGLEILLIQNIFDSDNRLGIKRKLAEYGPVSFVNKSFFALYSALEKKVSKLKSRDMPDPTTEPGRKLINVSPLHSRRNLVCRYSDDDLAKITELKLDLLVRGDGRGIYKGEILNVARDGFLSIHYGDNRVFRGIPAGFWEIYFKHRETGYIIQLLNEVLDGGQVLARGTIDTRSNHAGNWVAVSDAAHQHFSKILGDYATGNDLPELENSDAALGRLLTTPNIWQMFNYVRKIFT